jgi:hypothetical protein
MKNYLLSALLLLSCTFLFADTIDIYRVSFRNRQIGTFTEGKVINIVLKTDSVFSNDSIKVAVFRDSPCANCTDYTLMIFGKQGPMLVDSSQTRASFYVPLKPLVEYRRTNGQQHFHGYYTEYLPAGRARVISFRITLE